MKAKVFVHVPQGGIEAALQSWFDSNPGITVIGISQSSDSYGINITITIIYR